MALNLSELYLRLAKNLLPQGKAWSRERGSVLEKILLGLTDEFRRVHERALDLLVESDPRTATGSLEDWERIVGLPDDVQSVQPEVGSRREDILRKLTKGGGASAAFFIELAESFGYTVTVKDLRRFQAGRSHAGDQCWGDNAIFTFVVSSANVVPIIFRAGQSSAGQQLRVYRNDVLEAVINRAKPAHTTVTFSYGG